VATTTELLGELVDLIVSSNDAGKQRQGARGID
jgi:hypothetical protein